MIILRCLYYIILSLTFLLMIFCVFQLYDALIHALNILSIEYYNGILMQLIFTILFSLLFYFQTHNIKLIITIFFICSAIVWIMLTIYYIIRLVKQNGTYPYKNFNLLIASMSLVLHIVLISFIY